MLIPLILVATQCISLFNDVIADFSKDPSGENIEYDSNHRQDHRTSADKDKVSSVVTCQSLEVHHMKFHLNGAVGDFKNKAAQCCGVSDDDAALVDYWPYSCQVNSGYNELFNLDQKMEDCGYEHKSQGLTFMLAERVKQKESNMHSYMNVYHGASQMKKLNIKDDPTVLEIKERVASYTGLKSNCTTITDWYLNPEVDKDGGQLMNHKRLSDYGITSKNKKRMIIVLENVGCKRLTPGTWIMYKNNLIRNIECGEKELVSDFKSRASEVTGIPVEKIWAFDLLPNPKQDADGGQLLSHREMNYYGGCNDKIYVISELKECA